MVVVVAPCWRGSERGRGEGGRQSGSGFWNLVVLIPGSYALVQTSNLDEMI